MANDTDRAVMLVWGCVSAAQSGVHNYGGRVGVRFVLGFAEAPDFRGYVSSNAH